MIQPWCRTEVVRTRRREDPSADGWSEDGKANSGAPPGIETEHHDDRNARQSKQDQEVSGEVQKTGVQGKEETGDQPTKGERDEEEMINLEARIMRLEKTDPMDVPQDGRDDGIQRNRHGRRERFLKARR